MKAKFCDKCKHFNSSQFDSKPCLRGYKPRFYAPKNIKSKGCDDWGFKRRCNDFSKLEQSK